jgi:hypothetical protein
VANAGLVVLTPNPKTKLEVPINAMPRLYDCLINADDLELEELAATLLNSVYLILVDSVFD